MRAAVTLGAALASAWLGLGAASSLADPTPSGAFTALCLAAPSAQDDVASFDRRAAAAGFERAVETDDGFARRQMAAVVDRLTPGATVLHAGLAASDVWTLPVAAGPVAISGFSAAADVAGPDGARQRQVLCYLSSTGPGDAAERHAAAESLANAAETRFGPLTVLDPKAEGVMPPMTDGDWLVLRAGADGMAEIYAEQRLRDGDALFQGMALQATPAAAPIATEAEGDG
ncbi:MAG: hypothetical protein AAF899_17760 [Pseudomonadota bacterium]